MYPLERVIQSQSGLACAVILLDEKIIAARLLGDYPSLFSAKGETSDG